jgi:hypothetical protein
MEHVVRVPADDSRRRRLIVDGKPEPQLPRTVRQGNEAPGSLEEKLSEKGCHLQGVVFAVAEFGALLEIFEREEEELVCGHVKGLVLAVRPAACGDGAAGAANCSRRRGATHAAQRHAPTDDTHQSHLAHQGKCFSGLTIGPVSSSEIVG